MAKKNYKVDYHLICAIYFVNDGPSGTDLADLWSCLSRLDNRSVQISFMRRNDTDISTLKDSKLGSLELSEILIEKGNHLTSIGTSLVRTDAINAISDSDVNFQFSRNEIWNGQQAPAILKLSVSSQVIEQVGIKSMLEILNSFFHVADLSAPIFGLVNVAHPDDAFAGMVYGTAWPGNASLNHLIEQNNWVYSGAKKEDRMRGIYWGNYLGSKILNRLGGREAFIEVFSKHACYYDSTPNANLWQFTNGLFVSLCLDPLDSRPGLPMGLDPVIEANVKWLVCELGAKGVLNQW